MATYAQRFVTTSKILLNPVPVQRTNEMHGHGLLITCQAAPPWANGCNMFGNGTCIGFNFKRAAVPTWQYFKASSVRRCPPTRVLCYWPRTGHHDTTSCHRLRFRRELFIVTIIATTTVTMRVRQSNVVTKFMDVNTRVLFHSSLHVDV